jgi:hypothetical protein
VLLNSWDASVGGSSHGGWYNNLALSYIIRCGCMDCERLRKSKVLERGRGRGIYGQRHVSWNSNSAITEPYFISPLPPSPHTLLTHTLTRTTGHGLARLVKTRGAPRRYRPGAARSQVNGWRVPNSVRHAKGLLDSTGAPPPVVFRESVSVTKP